MELIKVTVKRETGSKVKALWSFFGSRRSHLGKAPAPAPLFSAGRVWGWGVGELGICGFVCAMLSGAGVFAQGPAAASARIDAKQIVVGDQARLFIEVQNNPALGRLQWATIPDTFNTLEVVEKGKIDTIKNGDAVTYRQRLLITGFDSGLFQVPSFVFQVVPNNGAPYELHTDSFSLLVQTVAVDTTKGFKGIKGIIYVKSSWLDYIWLIIGGIIFLALVTAVLIYFLRNKKAAPQPQGPVESLQDYALRLLGELDAKQLWQKRQVKQYYVELTDVVRNYIERRFNTPSMELTTDELLTKALTMPELQPYYELLSKILHTADLAKFAKFQPPQQEHLDAMARAKEFIEKTRPAPVSAATTDETASNNSTTDKTI